MGVRTVHRFLSACLRTNSDISALADYITCDSPHTNFAELVRSVLEEPDRIRLVVCNVDGFVRISFYISEHIRITAAFLEKMKNDEALTELASLLEMAPQSFCVSRGNPVLHTVVYEDLIGKELICIPRDVLGLAIMECQEKYVKSISQEAVAGWKRELRDTLGVKFKDILSEIL